MAVPNIVRNLKVLFKENTPQVLTAIGVAGAISTAVLSGRASYRAAQILAEEPPSTPTFEKVKLVWTLYIPPLSVAAVTVTSIILAQKIGTRRAAALATALTISEEHFREYRGKIVEKFGEKKEREVRDEINAEAARRVDIPQSVIIPSDSGQRCFDRYSKRWFTSTVNKLEKAMNKINYNMIHHDAASLNDFYSEIGLDPVPYGESIGWDAMDKLDLVITSFLDENNIPCVSVDFYNNPQPGYSSLH